jgi:polysaccharide pyruvyl transferase WcaK-like protein
MRDRKQISIVGGSIWGNRGAEAMLMTTIFQIWHYDPNLNFNVFSIYPEQDKQLLDDKRIEFLSGTPYAFALIYFPFALFYKIFRSIGIELALPQNLEQLKASQCLIDIGGITFSDGRTLQLLYNVFSIWPAMLLGVPVVKLSQALGPFEKALNRILAKKFLPKCQFVVARGEISEYHLETIGLPTRKYIQAADIAFLFEPKYSFSSENEDKITHLIKKLELIKTEGKYLISLIPSSLVLKQSKTAEINFIEKIITIITEASKKRIHFIVLPNASREGTNSLMNNDLMPIQAMRERIKEIDSGDIPYAIDWVDYNINTRSIRELVGMSDALITSRFHGMIAGLCQCIPTMVIGWSHKYQETLADFGVEQYAIDYRAELKEISNLFERFWSEREWIRKQLIQKIENIKASSRDQFKILYDEIIKLAYTNNEQQ